MEKPDHHIFVCMSFRGLEPKGKCIKRNAGELLGYLESELADRGLDSVMVSTTGCLKLCKKPDRGGLPRGLLVPGGCGRGGHRRHPGRPGKRRPGQGVSGGLRFGGGQELPSPLLSPKGMKTMETSIFTERKGQIHRKGDTPFKIECDKASVAGAVSQRACVFCGSRVVLYPIADALHIVHGPIGCAAYTWDIRGSLPPARNCTATAFPPTCRRWT